MKAVISKNQFDRIKNFINETKEIKKDEVLKEYSDKQLKAFDKNKNGIPFEPKDWKMMDEDFNRNDLDKIFNEIINNKPNSIGLSGYFPRIAGFRSELFEKLNEVLQKLFESNNTESYAKYLKNIILQEMVLRDMIIQNTPNSYRLSQKGNIDGEDYFTKAKRIYGEGKIESILNIIEKNIIEMKKLTNGKLYEKKKHSKKKLDTFDFDGDGKPFEPRDLAALRASKKLSKELDEGSDCGCGDDKDDTRYMFFSNLEQMMRQARMLLQMDEDMLEDLLNNGHDWAADHIAEAKNNMDQVFDFIMNEMNGEGEDDSWDNQEGGEEKQMVYEGMRLKKKAFVSKELKNHLDKNIPLYESEFKYGSEKHIELLKEVKELYKKGIISLNETDEFMVNEFNPKPVKVKGVGEVYLGLIQEEYESDEELLSEAVYQGRKVQLGKRMAGDVKKFKVYVRNDKGNVVKVNFGQKGMKIKKHNPARRKSFRARMHCDNPGPRWKANYWSCRAW
jgi:hypothetical protein